MVPAPDTPPARVAVPEHDHRPLTVLITAIAMVDRDGSTMYTRDLALELARTGHRPIVYTALPGEVSEELERRGVEVVERLDQLEATPDVIHGNHTLETADALARLPGVPGVFVCHGLGGWMAEPPLLSGVRHWIAVGSATLGRLEKAGIPVDRRSLVPNGVDTRRFRVAERVRPSRPRRALVFSNNASPGGYVDTIVAACEARGIELDVRGKGVGRPLESPEEELGSYDLVFARGRCAREAICCGAAVVVVDMEGQGHLVTTSDVNDYDTAAFGHAMLTDPHDEITIGHEIDRYDVDDAAEVTRRLRQTSSIEAMAGRLLEIYRSAIDEVAPPPDLEADREWLLRQLPVMSRIGLDRDAVVLARHLLHQHALTLEARVLTAEPALHQAQEELTAQRRELDERAGELAGAHAALAESARRLEEARTSLEDSVRELDEAQAALAAIEATRTFRLRRRVLASPVSGAASRWLARRAPQRT